MTLAALSGMPIPFPTYPYRSGVGSTWKSTYALANIGTMDAATEKVAFIGRVWWAGGASSKTISSSGGKIHFQVGTSTTFAAAAGATTLQVGIQDTTQAATRITPDGTFDVSKTLASATDTLTSSTVATATMSTGSKTITAGQKIAVVFDMLTRGSPDSVKIQGVVNSALAAVANPGNISYIGAWWFNYADAWGPPCVMLEADDGTRGWLMGGTWGPAAVSTHASIQSSSNPDEYGLLFTPTWACTLHGAFFPVKLVSGGASGTGAVARISSGSAASPTLIEAVNIDGLEIEAGEGAYRMYVPFATPRDLTAGTTYILSFRSNATVLWTHEYLSFANAADLGFLPFGTTGYKVSREASTDGTGAFTEVTTDLYPVELIISNLSDNASSGGGGGLRVIGG